MDTKEIDRLSRQSLVEQFQSFDELSAAIIANYEFTQRQFRSQRAKAAYKKSQERKALVAQQTLKFEPSEGDQIWTATHNWVQIAERKGELEMRTLNYGDDVYKITLISDNLFSDLSDPTNPRVGDLAYQEDDDYSDWIFVRGKTGSR